MKCPKCSYLGYETTDRCRNCGYDFSFAAPPLASELPLRSSVGDAPLEDLILGDTGATAPSAIDPLADRLTDAHDRDVAGFGRPEPRSQTDYTAAIVQSRVEAPASESGANGDARSLPPEDLHPESEEDLPLFAPRPAGTPLAVRRPGNDVPRARRNTTRPVRMETPVLPLVMDVPESEPVEAPPVRVPKHVPAASSAHLGIRLAAALVDATLLLGIDATALWLTLRIAGLQPNWQDLAVIRPLPMSAFFLVMAFLYLVGFTLGGGQTIGKMLTGIRVTGDDGRRVDLTGAVVRALGSLLSVCTFGVLFVSVLFSTDRRAVHDRLAGTRVVNG
jgi:uncharacterized RDD family membrane protein YckC